MKNGPYELIIAPEKYPGKKYRGRYCYEHIHNWWKQHGSLPPHGYEIHHKNGNHRDNRLENLVMVTMSEHRKLHGKIISDKASHDVSCSFCGIRFKRRGNMYRTALKTNKTGKMYCSKSCQYNSMRKQSTPIDEA